MLFKLFRILLFALTLQANGQTCLINVFDARTGVSLRSAYCVAGEDTIREVDGQIFLRENFKDVKLGAAGYLEAEINITGRTQIKVYLQTLPLAGLISVVANREKPLDLQLPASYEHIDLTKSSPDDVYKILQQQNGIIIKSYGGTAQTQQIALRGHTAEQTQVMYDGVLLNSLQLGTGNMGSCFSGANGSMDIYRGGNALLGGSGSIGGTINIRPIGLRDSLKYGFGYNWNTQRNNEEDFHINVPVSAFRVAANLQNGDGLNLNKVVYNGSRTELKNRDFQRQTVSLQAAYKPGSYEWVNVLYRHYGMRGGAPKPFSGPSAENSNLARQSDDNNLYRLRLSWINSKAIMHFLFYGRNEWMTYNDPLFSLQSRHLNHEDGLRADGSYQIHSNDLLHLGLETAWQRINSSNAGQHKRQRSALFILNDYKFPEWQPLNLETHLNSSLRYEKYGDEQHTILPAASVSVNTNHWQGYFTTGANYRLPTFNELYWQPGGNPDLKAEKSINYEAGWTWQNSYSGWYFSFKNDLFQSQVTDQITWFTRGSVSTPQNISSVLSKGYEVSLDLSVPDGIMKTTLRYAYTYAIKNKTDFPGDNTKGHSIALIPRHQFTVDNRFTWWQFNGGLNMDFTGKRFNTLQNDHNDVLDAFITMGFWLQYGPFYKPSVKIWFVADNLFNHPYQMYTGYPMPGQNFTIGVSINN